jgi:lipopolysaccharide export system protein LptA
VRLPPRARIALVAALVAFAARAYAADPEPAKPPAASGQDAAAQRLGLRLDRSQPYSIRADEFEVVREASGAERFTFQRNVEFQQGDLRMNCDWAEALQPSGAASGPDRVLARGNVRLHWSGGEATCADAEFDRKAQRVLCRGGDQSAQIVRGDDVVGGREIELDLAHAVYRVRGGASVTMRPAEAPKP